MTTAQQIQAAAQGGVVDVALQQSPTTPGKLTWVWQNGDRGFDTTATYPVLSFVMCHKGRWRADRTFGTLLHTLRRDRRTTGSQIAAYIRDGGAAAEAARVASAVTAQPTKLGPGKWRVKLSWVAAGKQQVREMNF